MPEGDGLGLVDSVLRDPPSGWRVTRLRDVVESAVDGPFGSNLKTEHYVEEPGVRVVRLQNVNLGRFDDTDKAYITKQHALSLMRHEVTAGDLLVASMGDDRHPIARACLYPRGFPPGIVKADCFRFRLDRTRAHHGFVMHGMNCPATRVDIDRLGQGVTRDRVNLTTVQSIRLPFPPLSEQRRIAEVLNSYA